MNIKSIAPHLAAILGSLEGPGDFISFTWLGNPGFNRGLGVGQVEMATPPDPEDDLFLMPIPRLIKTETIEGIAHHEAGAVVFFNATAIIVAEKFNDLVKVLNPPQAA